MESEIFKQRQQMLLFKGGLMENVDIKVRNYTCTEKQNKNIKNKLEFLLRQVPCASYVSLELEYKDKAFYGKLKVNFNGKSFFATDEALMLAPLTSSLCKKVQKQVMKWKKTRTVEEITGVTVINLPAETDIPLEPSFYKKVS